MVGSHKIEKDHTLDGINTKCLHQMGSRPAFNAPLPSVPHNSTTVRPPVVRPPSPTVHPERVSPPKPVPRRDPRLLAVRIEKKQAVPFSKKVLEDHGITQPQGNPKYFAPGQQFNPMLDLLPGSQKSRLWTAENRQGFLQATPLHHSSTAKGVPTSAPKDEASWIQRGSLVLWVQKGLV